MGKNLVHNLQCSPQASEVIVLKKQLLNWVNLKVYLYTNNVNNLLTPRDKAYMIQSFLTFEPMDRNFKLKCNHSLESCSIFPSL